MMDQLKGVMVYNRETGLGGMKVSSRVGVEIGEKDCREGWKLNSSLPTLQIDLRQPNVHMSLLKAAFTESKHNNDPKFKRDATRALHVVSNLCQEQATAETHERVGPKAVQRFVRGAPPLFPPLQAKPNLLTLSPPQPSFKPFSRKASSLPTQARRASSTLTVCFPHYLKSRELTLLLELSVHDLPSPTFQPTGGTSLKDEFDISIHQYITADELGQVLYQAAAKAQCHNSRPLWVHRT
jgi:hypothetical protein